MTLLHHIPNQATSRIIPYLIFMKFAALNAEINIVSSSYNFHIILFLLSLLRINLKTKFNCTWFLKTISSHKYEERSIVVYDK